MVKTKKFVKKKKKLFLKIIKLYGALQDNGIANDPTGQKYKVQII